LNFENLIGSAFNDTFTENSGSNILDGRAGADTMIGGAGDDTYIVDNVGDIVTENINEGLDRINTSVSYSMSNNVEVMQLTGIDNINATGTSTGNTIYGNSGNNTLDGAAGTDTLSYYYATTGVTVHLGLTTSQNTLGAGIDTILNFENLTGSNYNDTLAGDNFANTIKGGLGNDTLKGGLGNDGYTLNIGDGIDSIYDYDMGSNTSNAGSDIVQFGAGVTTASVALFKSGNDLVLSYGATDKITISNQSNVNNAIEKFTLSDGNYLTSANIDVIIQSMNAYAVDHGISISSIDSVRNDQNLMNIVAAGWHK
jgi:Ca2+-binding RTX toxin-like protein